MRIVYFTHSLASCWNHGNAHFLRGVLRELVLRGHAVQSMEPQGAWSLANLLRDHGEATLDDFKTRYPELAPRAYEGPDAAEAAVDRADVVIVHEWNDPALVSRIGRLRRRGARFALLFHDTHHRAVSDPEAIRAFDLDGYDGVLAFGETLAEVYRRWGWANRVFVWHEAADTRLFRPPAREGRRDGLVWIGNWGDGERSDELREFLLQPAGRSGMALDIHGVRYPEDALRLLRQHEARYRGWLPNALVPDVFARHLATIHVPRRFYVKMLPGIPTIRVFEALACGIPLLCAPWQDSEQLFRPGTDFLVARNGEEMTQHLRTLSADAGMRAALAARGFETIRARHSCAHRVDELLDILARLGMPQPAPIPVEGEVG